MPSLHTRPLYQQQQYKPSHSPLSQSQNVSGSGKVSHVSLRDTHESGPHAQSNNHPSSSDGSQATRPPQHTYPLPVFTSNNQPLHPDISIPGLVPSGSSRTSSS